VNKNGLNEYCRFLGVLPRDEQIALIRAATGVIHPSKFEGRGAIVEEATLLGAQLLCSDLPVHRELHAPGALFFRVDCVEELAELLQHKYQRSNKDTETIIDESHRLARAYGEKFIGMCKRVVESRSD
jgi:glycosyltransferase involved in cell wall biosynthesis